MDVKTIFLHGVLIEEIYMNQPPSFEIFGTKHEICQLLRTRYDLKQSPRMWYERFNAYLLNVDFLKIKKDPNVYIKRSTHTFCLACNRYLVHCFRY